MAVEKQCAPGVALTRTLLGEKAAIVKRRLQEASRETGIKIRSSWEDKSQRALLWKGTAKR